MNISKLLNITQKPEIYAKGTAVMWVDEHISTQLLQTHLSQDIDLASRKETTISSTLNWIQEQVPGERLNILDLGCGPGLYTEKLAENGHVVTGLDFSARSINYARESAKEKNLTISYVTQDYLELRQENEYDLIMMIFTDFGVLTPEQRKILLANIYRALKPGGRFLFDVLNESYPVNNSGVKDWEVSVKGFWRDDPYLALTESFYYEEQRVSLSQHTVVDQTGNMEIYRFWVHTFSNTDLVETLNLAGFYNPVCYGNILPGCQMYRAEDVTFCIATKE